MIEEPNLEARCLQDVLKMLFYGIAEGDTDMPIEETFYGVTLVRSGNK